MTIAEFSLKTFIKSFILALSYINNSGYQVNTKSSMYYIIDSEWNELNDNDEYKAQSTPWCTY